MIVLDTNVLSELMRSEPAAAVFAWVSAQPRATLYTTSVSKAEILYGIAVLPEGRRRLALAAAAEAMFADDFEGRVLPFDEAAAEAASRLAARRQRGGATADLRDTQIAGIATARRAAVATRNIRYFHGLQVDVINPWQAH